MENMGQLLKNWTNKPEFESRYQEVIDTLLKDKDIHEFIVKHQLPVEIVEKSYAKFKEYINERDARLQGTTVKNPEMQPVLLLSNGYVDVAYEPTVFTLKKRQEKELKQHVRLMNMPKQLRDARLPEVELTAERVEVVEKIVQFITNLEQGHAKGLYLAGEFGVGKTYLFGALANELALKGYYTTLVYVPTLSVEMKQAIGDNTLREKLDELKKAPILILDDIGAESNTVWFRDEVLGVLLQHRMMQELPTFFTSNFTMNELEEHFRVSQKQDDEALKAKRLMERVRYLSEEVVLMGQNRRR